MLVFILELLGLRGLSCHLGLDRRLQFAILLLTAFRTKSDHARKLRDVVEPEH